MNKDLLERMLLLDNFVVEKETGVDDVPVYIRPLYIELLSLNPSMQRAGTRHQRPDKGVGS